MSDEQRKLVKKDMEDHKITQVSDAEIVSAAMETPPRAWGRQFEVDVGIDPARNTPTGVGKTKTVKV